MNFQLIQHIVNEQWYQILPVKVGQLIEVQENIGEGNNKRIWKFRGIVLRINKPNNHDGSFVLRGESSGVKIEKIYPLSYNKFQKVELLDEYKVRKSRLFYHRTKIGKAAKMKSIISKENRGASLLKPTTSAE
jgi:large subunit ribosomal protein L19